MKREYIKRGTYIIMISVFILFIIIIIAGTFFVDRKIAGEEEAEKTAKLQIWGDSLRNSASDCEALRPMDADVQQFINRFEIRGISLAVMRHDSLLYAKGYGWADKEKNIPMEANTIARIASVSKLVTAATIMRLVEKGRFSLDDRLFGDGGLLADEDYAAGISDDRMKEITVRQLLCHEAGFTNRRGDPMFNYKEIMEAEHLGKAPDKKQLASIVLSRRLGYAPGSGHKYSNFGYFLLSLLIEKTEGKSYWEAVEENVLHPAGCYNFKPATNYYADRHPNETKYYAPDDSIVEEYTGSGKMVNRVYGGSNVNGLLGGGGWVASAADLARFVASIDGETHVRDIISRRSFEEMTRFEKDKKVSFGWSSVDEAGKLQRTGTLSSTNAVVQVFPDGECWIIITNTGYWTGFKFAHEITRLIERMRSRYSDNMPRRDLF